MMGKSFKMLINRGFDPIGGGGTLGFAGGLEVKRS